MKKRYTKPEWMQVTLAEADVIACSEGKLTFADDNSGDTDCKDYW